jgi:hypothetical protein
VVARLEKTNTITSTGTPFLVKVPGVAWSSAITKPLPTRQD